jgi:hypothetical protein
VVAATSRRRRTTTTVAAAAAVGRFFREDESAIVFLGGVGKVEERAVYRSSNRVWRSLERKPSIVCIYTHLST